MGHHDGTNYTLYRIAKDRDEAERIADKIYNREIDEEGFRRRTRSLYPYVAAVYGWKTGRNTEPSPFIISSIPFYHYSRSNIRLLYRPRSFVYLPSFLLSITGLVLPDAKVGRRT